MEKYRKIPSKVRVSVAEKVDGSNVSFKKHYDGSIEFFSRNRELGTKPEEKVFSKLNKLYESDFYNKMILEYTYFGELLGQAKLPYNNRGIKPLNEELFIFDVMDSRGEYVKQSDFVTFDLGEFLRPKFNVIYISELSEYLDTLEEKVSFIDDKVKVEGVVVKSFDSNDFVYKVVNKSFNEVFHKETKMANLPMIEKYVQKYVYEEPSENWKQFIQMCKRDFNEEWGSKLNTGNFQEVILKNKLAELITKEIFYTDGFGIEHSKELIIDIKKNK